MDLIQILSHPVWQGIGAIVAILALALGVYAELFRNKSALSSPTKIEFFSTEWIITIFVGLGVGFIFSFGLFGSIALQSYFDFNERLHGKDIVSMCIGALLLCGVMIIVVYWRKEARKPSIFQAFLLWLFAGGIANMMILLSLALASVLWIEGQVVFIELMKFLGLS